MLGTPVIIQSSWMITSYWSTLVTWGSVKLPSVLTIHNWLVVWNSLGPRPSSRGEAELANSGVFVHHERFKGTNNG